MQVEFESAVISRLHSKDVDSNKKVGWLLPAIDVHCEHLRYRCFHVAHLLGPEFESVYLTGRAQVRDAIPGLAVLIVLNRVDRGLLELAQIARDSGVPVFLDLSEDLLHPRHARNRSGLNLMNFLGAASFLQGVTVPSAPLADRLENYAINNGVSGLQIHVVPDAAETWDVYRATVEAVLGVDAGSDLDILPEKDLLAPKQVIWWGDFGSSHGNSGIFSLRRYLGALRSVNRDIPLELVVLSNNEAVYRAMVHECGFPTRYVELTPSALYSELTVADVALIASGNDEFATVQSSARVLHALAADVPVITDKGPALAEFEESIFSGRISDALHNSLGPSRTRLVRPLMNSAKLPLARYSPSQTTKIWSGLLSMACDERSQQQFQKRPGKTLFVVERGDSMAFFRGLISAANALQDLEFDLLISTEFIEDHPEIDPVLRKVRTIPRFFSGACPGALNVMSGVSALVVDRPFAPVASALCRVAKRLGVPIITAAEAATGSLDGLVRKPDLEPVARSVIRAGRYEERIDPDGGVDWAFLVDRKAKGWILDAICREIGSRQPSSWTVVYHPEAGPPAKNVFYSHYALFEKRNVKSNSGAFGDPKVFVWYTHPREENPVTVAKRLLAFEQVTKVVFACESNRRVWVNRGLSEDKTAVVLGGADGTAFGFHERGTGVIGLSSSFYERKNPDRLLEVVKLLPHRQFLLLGRNWNRYARFEELRALANFSYRTAPYREYPSIYATFDVFLSMSSLEGGPIPLIEAMMCNAVPVASRTGFAPDVIRHGRNGFIFDLDASAVEIAELIDAAYSLPGNVRKTVELYDWDNFSASVVNLAK